MGLVELNYDGMTYNLLPEDCEATVIKTLYGREDDNAVLVAKDNRVIKMSNDGKFNVVPGFTYKVIFGQQTSIKT